MATGSKTTRRKIVVVLMMILPFLGGIVIVYRQYCLRNALQYYPRVKDGMSESEVEALLGGAAHEYAQIGVTGPNPPSPEDFFVAFWHEQNATVSIEFLNGLVLSKSIGPPGRRLSGAESTWSVMRRLRRLMPIGE